MLIGEIFIADTLEETTHWLPTKDNLTWEQSHVTIGHLYKMEIDPDDGEYIVYDDRGVSSMIWLGHNGRCLNFNNMGW